MKIENIFINLPQGKTTGFCQPVGSSVWKDGGVVVQIFEDCVRCSVAKCMMFEFVAKSGKKFIKKYTEHKPEWNQ